MPQPENKEQNVVYLLTASCLKEFEEILLLGGNGYGSGATKLLRAFYERVVTLSYLAMRPEKTQQFIDYTDIHWHKVLTEAHSIHASVDLKAELLEAIENNYEKAKDRFMEDPCKCGKKRVQMSWTKAPVPELVSKISSNLRLLCFNAYLRPTFFLHTTYLGVTTQAQLTDEGKLKPFGTEVERKVAREALELAHVLLVHVTDVLNDYFKLGQEQRVKQLGEDWKECWPKIPRAAP